MTPAFSHAISNLKTIEEKIRALSTAGFNSSQIESLLVDYEKLDANVVKLTLANAGLTTSIDGVNASQAISNALNHTSNEEDKKALSSLLEKIGLKELDEKATLGQIKANLAAKEAELGLSATERQRLVELGLLPPATKASATATEMLTGAFTKLKTAIAGLSIAMKGLLIAIAIFTVLKIGKAVWNHFNTSLEELQEKAQDSSSALQETESELQSLQSELETTTDRIEELESVGTLTLIEEKELSKLKATQSYLEGMIALKKMAAADQAKTAVEDAKNVLNQETRADLSWGTIFDGTAFEKTTVLEKADKELKKAEELEKQIQKDKEEFSKLDTSTIEEGTEEWGYYNRLKDTIAQNEEALKEHKENVSSILSENSEYMLTIAEQNLDEEGRVLDDEANEILQHFNKINSGLRVLNEGSADVIQDLISDISNSQYESTGKYSAKALLNLSEDDLKNTGLVDEINQYIEDVQKELNDQGYDFTIDDIKLSMNFDEKQIVKDAKEQLENNLNSSNLFNTNLSSPGFSNVAGVSALGTSNSQDQLAKGEYRNIILGANNEQLSILSKVDWTENIYKKALNNFPKIKQLVSDVSEYITDSFNKKPDTKLFDELKERGEELGVSVEDWVNTYTNGVINLGEVIREQLVNIALESEDNIENSLKKTSVVSSKTAKKVAQSFSSMWSSEEWQEANSDMVDLARTSTVTAQDVQELAAKDETLANILNMQGMSAQFAANCLNQIGAGGSAFNLITADALSLNSVLNEMATSFDQVSEARSKYEAGKEKEDYNGDYQSFATAYDDIMASFEKGEYGRQFDLAAEYLLGKNSYSMTIDEVYKAVSGLDGILDDVDSNGLGLLEELSKLNFSNLELEGDSYVTKLADGSYDWEIAQDDIHALAEALNMSDEAFISCIKALGMFDGTRFYNIENLAEVVKNLDMGMQNTSKDTVLSQQALSDLLQTLGYTGREAYEIIKDISDLDGVKVLDFENTGVSDLVKELKQIPDFKKVLKDKNFTPEETDTLFSTLHDNFNMSGEDISDFAKRLAEAGYKFVDAEGNALSFKEVSKQAFEQGDVEQYGVSVEEATSQLNTLKEAVDELNDPNDKLELEADISEYEAAIKQAQEDGGLVPTEITTKIKFEIDRASLLKQIEEAKEQAQWQSGSEKVQTKGTQISKQQQYIESQRTEYGLGKVKSEKGSVISTLRSDIKKTKQEAIELNDQGYTTEAIAKQEIVIDKQGLETQLNEFFHDYHPEITSDSDKKDIEKATAFTDKYTKKLGITSETSEKDAETAINNFSDYYNKKIELLNKNGLKLEPNTEKANEKFDSFVSMCESTGIEIDFSNENSTKQLDEFYQLYSSTLTDLNNKGLNLKFGTKEANEQIMSVLSLIPENVLIDILADPEKGFEVLSKFIKVAEDGTVTLTLDSDPKKAEKQYKDTKKKIERDTATAKVDADTSNFDSKTKTSKNKAEKTVTTPVDADTSLANQKIESMREKGSRTINTTLMVNEVVRKVNSSFGANALTQARLGLHTNGTANLLGSAYASGRWGVPKAEKGALVGELGPEIMVDPYSGYFTTVGDNGPEFVDIPKNAIIFNHIQSKSLLENGYALGRGKIANGSAHLTGTAYAPGATSGGNTKKKTYKNISDGKSASNSNKSSSSNESGTSSSDNSGNTNKGNNKTTTNKTTKEVKELSSLLSEAFDQFFDWIEVRIDRLEKNISYYEAKASNYTHYRTKNKMINEQISNLKMEIKVDQDGYKKYKTQADNIITIAKSKIDSNAKELKKNVTGKDKKTITDKKSKIDTKASNQKKQIDAAVKLIKSGGKVDISKYSNEVQSVINEYKEWYDKAVDLNVALQENKAKLEELASTKLENIQNYYDNREGLKSVDISNKQGYVDYIQSRNNYSLSTSSYGNSSHYNSVKDAYISIISDLKSNSKYLAEEKSKLQKQLDFEVKTGNIKKYSNTWFEWQNAINSLTGEIYDAKSQTEEYYKSLYGLPLEKASQAVEKLAKSLDLLKSKADVVSGGSQIYDRVVASDAKTDMNSKKKSLDKASSTLKSKKSKVSSSLKRSKVSSSTKKKITKAMNSNSKISTSGLSGSLLKTVNEYNASLNTYRDANSKYTASKNTYNKAVSTQKSNSKNYNYKLSNKYLDKELENVKQQNADNQSALRSANVTLASKKADKEAKQNAVNSKAKTLSKYKLSSAQKKAIKEGKSVSTSGLSGKALKAAQDYNKAIANLSDSTIKYNAALAVQNEAVETAAQSQIDYAEAIQSTAKEKFDNVITEFDGLCDGIASNISKLQSKLEWLNNINGSYKDKNSTLQNIYSNTKSEVSKKRDEINLAQSEYNKNKNNMNDEARLEAQKELNSLWSDYYELLSSERDVLQEILDLNNQVAFDSSIDKLERMGSELDVIKGLINTSLVDNKGNITKAGKTSIALTAQAIADAKEQTGYYNAKIKELYGAYKSGIINSEQYTDRVNECRDAINNNASAIQSYKNELIDLYKEQMQKELDTLNEVIEKRKTALSSMKEYYDYADNIKTQNKDIESLQAQIAALRGVDDQASKAQLAQLKSQLKDSQKELDNSIKDHRYEVITSGFDKLSSSAQENYDNMVTAIEISAKKQEEIVNKMLENIKTSYKAAYSEIRNIISEYGLNISAGTSSQISNLSSQTGAKNTVSNAEKDQSKVNTESFKKSIQNFIDKLPNNTRSKSDLNDRKKSSELYAYVAKKYGKALSTSNTVYLGNLLGVNGLPKDYTKITNNNKNDVLKALKNAGFSSGGIIEDSFTPLNSIFDVIKTNGDNSLIIGAKSGESIMTEQFTAMLPELLKNIDIFNDTFDSIKNMDFSTVMSSQPVTFSIHYDNLLNIEGNVDKSALPELKEILKQSYEYTSKMLKKELSKSGWN